MRPWLSERGSGLTELTHELADVQLLIFDDSEPGRS
jgi:hypothetical protein